MLRQIQTSIITIIFAIASSSFALEPQEILQAQDIFCNKYIAYFTLGMNDVFKNSNSLQYMLKQDAYSINRFRSEIGFDMEGFVTLGYKNGREEATLLKGIGVKSVEDQRAKKVIMQTTETCRYEVARSLINSGN